MLIVPAEANAKIKMFTYFACHSVNVICRSHTTFVRFTAKRHHYAIDSMQCVPTRNTAYRTKRIKDSITYVYCTNIQMQKRILHNIMIVVDGCRQIQVYITR